MHRQTKMLGRRWRAWGGRLHLLRGERGSWGGAEGHSRSAIYFESLLVVLLIGGLAATIAPRAIQCTTDCALLACAQSVVRINLEVERWHSEKGTWPKAGLSDIGADVDYFPGGLPLCPVDGSPYELDPVTHRVKRHRHGEPEPSPAETGTATP